MRTGISGEPTELGHQYRRDVVIPNMLCLEISSPELDLMPPIFYARRGVGIPAINIGKFCSNFVKSEVSDIQDFNEMTLFQFR
jgi:hypothetical protein